MPTTGLMLHGSTTTAPHWAKTACQKLNKTVGPSVKLLRHRPASVHRRSCMRVTVRTAVTHQSQGKPEALGTDEDAVNPAAATSTAAAAAAADEDSDPDDEPASADGDYDDGCSSSDDEQQQLPTKKAAAAETAVQQQAKAQPTEPPTSTAGSSSSSSSTDSGSSSSSSSRTKGADILVSARLQVLAHVIAPVLQRFALGNMILTLSTHIKAGSMLHRGAVRYEQLCKQVALLCDPRIPEQLAQGCITCYVGAAWVLEKSEIDAHMRPRAPVQVDAEDSASMELSIAGALLTSQKAQILTSSRLGARALLSDCPWIWLTPASGTSWENRLTVNFSALASCADKDKLENFLRVLPAAIREAHGVTIAPVERGSLAAVLLSEAETSEEKKHNTAKVLAGIALRTVFITYASAGKLGRIRHALRNGMPVKLDQLAAAVLKDFEASPKLAQRKPTAASIAQVLDKMLRAEGRPLWTPETGRGWWVLNLRQLMQDKPWLLEAAAPFITADGRLPATGLPAAAAAALTPHSAATTPASKSLSGAATPTAASAAAAAKAAAEDAGEGARARLAAAYAAMSGRPAKGAAAYAAAVGASAAAASAYGRPGGGATAAARLSPLFGPYISKRGPASGLDYTKPLPGFGAVHVGIFDLVVGCVVQDVKIKVAHAVAGAALSFSD